MLQLALGSRRRNFVYHHMALGAAYLRRSMYRSGTPFASLATRAYQIAIGVCSVHPSSSLPYLDFRYSTPPFTHVHLPFPTPPSVPLSPALEPPHPYMLTSTCTTHLAPHVSPPASFSPTQLYARVLSNRLLPSTYSIPLSIVLQCQLLCQLLR